MVRINDRGPHTPHRQLDLSKAAGRRLGMAIAGAQVVSMQVVKMGKGAQGADPYDTATFAAVPRLDPATLPRGESYNLAGKTMCPQGYALQVASYFSGESAVYDAMAIRNAGFKDVFIQIPQSGDAEPLYRVMVGQFSSREKALVSKAVLAGKGWESFPAHQM